MNLNGLQVIAKKEVENRNKILKTTRDSKLISVYTEQLVYYGLKIQQKRKVLVDEFNLIVSKLFREISDLTGNLSIEYSSSWKSENSEEIIKSLEQDGVSSVIFRTNRLVVSKGADSNSKDLRNDSFIQTTNRSAITSA